MPADSEGREPLDAEDIRTAMEATPMGEKQREGLSEWTVFSNSRLLSISAELCSARDGTGFEWGG